MPTSGEIVRKAFDDWMNGTGYVASIFSPDMTWEIVGHSAASSRYSTAQEFQDKVLAPFARRFQPDKPFRPVNIRGFYVDGDTVIVIWDGAGTTIIDTAYENTYAWIMTLENGRVVDGTAFYDSISFNKLWEIEPSSG
jgi:ketosteroid isomerase-like protein